MNLFTRYRRLTIWNKIAFWGAIASILSLIVYFIALIANYSVGTDSQRKYLEPHNIEIKGGYFEVYSRLKNTLWAHEVSGEIAKAAIDDLNRDNEKEVIIGIKGKSKDTGKIIVFNHKGEILWKFHPTLKFNYSGGRSDKLAVNNFQVASLFKTGQK